MLIPLRQLKHNYQLKIKGVIHVGAHIGQEYNDYIDCGARDIVFVEPCSWQMQKLFNRFRNDPAVKLYQYAAGATLANGVMKTASFNKGESNSLLQPLLHLQQHPEVVFDGTEEVKIVPLDARSYFDFNPSLYNFLAMDVQGYEGEVLKGATETLKHIDYVYTEVNKGQTYEGNALVEEIDALLSEFTRVETKWAGNTTWGDAFFLRTSKMKLPY